MKVAWLYHGKNTARIRSKNTAQSARYFGPFFSRWSACRSISWKGFWQKWNYRGLESMSRPNKWGGEKEEMVLDWTCPEERSEQRLCCCPWMDARGEEKQRQTQNYLALHCRERERQTRMEHMGKSEAGSKQPPAVEGRCSGLAVPPGTRRIN